MNKLTWANISCTIITLNLAIPVIYGILVSYSLGIKEIFASVVDSLTSFPCIITLLVVEVINLIYYIKREKRSDKTREV